VPARVFRSSGPARGWLVWAHGGSWIRGSVHGWHQPCADLAEQAGCTVVSVEYRLAPRHPHPAALNDFLTVLEWAATQTGDEEVAVGGDSAGGTIAACAALTWRDQGRSLAAQVLAYPPMDPQCRASSYDLDSFPTRVDMIEAWQTYRGDGHDDAYSTPFESTDLRGMAPALLAVGALDPVSGDVRDYANRLRTAGNSVDLKVFPGLPHGVFLPPGPMRRWLGTSFRNLISSKETS
jgi:acetyl esterase